MALGKLLNIAHSRALPTVTLCHGPAVALATCLEGTGQTECAYKGYRTMCFVRRQVSNPHRDPVSTLLPNSSRTLFAIPFRQTDKTDDFTPKLGYLPGTMPWKVQEALEAKGMTVVNKSETGAVVSDRELITGDSPNAAHNLGVWAAPLLVKYAADNGL